jgi:tetratricopeptide (TPR) repeat protein
MWRQTRVADLLVFADRGFMKSIHSIAAVLVLGGLLGCSSHDSGAQLNAQANNPNTPDPRTVDPGPAPKLSSNTYFAAGQFAETQGDTLTAIKQYNAALKVDPNNQMAIYRLAVIYTETKQYPQGIATWQRYIRVTNKAAEAYGNLGFCYELAGRPSDAANAYQQGIARDPDNIFCRTNFGLMRARQDRIEEAMSIWKPVLTEAEIHYNLASVYQLEGRKAQALIEYQKTLELDPKMDDARSRMASCQ